MYRECKKCKEKILREILDKNHFICPYCGNLLRIHAYKRIGLLADAKSFCEWDVELNNRAGDIHEDYAKKIEENAKMHNLREAVVIGEMKIYGQHVAIGVMDTRFMMASMGRVVGEKVTRLFDKAIKKKLPVILFCCSGGARMQEGILSLMQMEKTAAAVKRHSNAGLLYISVLTNPTMGGVSASFAMTADIVLAEEGAQIGFAGARVIEDTTGVKLPRGMQNAEFQMEHGFLDAIVGRETMKAYLAELVRLHNSKKAKIKNVYRKIMTRPVIYHKISAWEKVKIARGSDRATTREYIDKIFDSFTELCGDRISKEDPAILGGIAYIDGIPVTVIGHQKGKKNLQEAMHYNWGMPTPAGYRKALRLMEQAEKFKRPIICFVDTIGASCNEEAEKQGQSLMIAKLLQATSDFKVPILSVIISEGGSGGALALGVGNEVWMLENAVYSVITPEGYASILWKDSERAKEAAELMGLEANELYNLGIIDKIIWEEEPATKENIDAIASELKGEMINFLKKYERMSASKIVRQRQLKFRKY